MLYAELWRKQIDIQIKSWMIGYWISLVNNENLHYFPERYMIYDIMLVEFNRGQNFKWLNYIYFQNIALNPEVCKMGGNFWLQNGLNLFCRVWPRGQHPKWRMVWSQLDAVYDFQNLYQFSNIAIFEKIVKIPFLQKCQNFECFFSVVHLAVHMHTMNLFKIWLTKKNSWKNEFFTFFYPKN